MISFRSHKSKRTSLERELSHRHRIWLVCAGAATGLVAGVAITFYRLALAQAEQLMRSFTLELGKTVLGIFIWFLILMGIVLIVGTLIKKVPLSSGSGIPQVEAEVAGTIEAPWLRVLPAKFVEGVLCTFAGLSLGREGPSVQIGGMAAKLVSKLAKSKRGEERILITCGAASGMAAAFHAPFTGVMFALEEIHKVFSAPVIVSVMVASVMADLFSSILMGTHAVLSLTFLADLPPSAYISVAFLGVIAGLLGALHNAGMFAAQNLFDRITCLKPYIKLLPAFLISGVVAFTMPQLLCGGDAIIQLLERGTITPVHVLLALLIGKYLLTALCFGSGAPGGTLLPLVVMGALIGNIYGICVTDITTIPSVFVANYTVLGVASLFAGVVRAPITGIVLAFELTGSLDSLLAASLVSIVAYVTSDLIGIDAFYEHLLGRIDISQTNPESDNQDDVTQEGVFHRHIVGAGSAAEGKLIRDLVLPERLLIVMITRSGKELVPQGSTRLNALDQLLVLEDAELELENEEMLKQLCAPSLNKADSTAE